MAGAMNNMALTPAAQRTVARCRRLAAESARQDSWVTFLVLTLVLDESLASACLIRLGITQEWLMSGELGTEVARSAANRDHGIPAPDTDEECPSTHRRLNAIDDPLDFTKVLDRATEIARRGLGDGGVSSMNLLLAIMETSDFVRERFAATGVTVDRIRAELLPESTSAESRLHVDDETVLSLNTESTDVIAAEFSSIVVTSQSDVVWRVVDASLNRAREGMRVLEDFARFVANDEATSFELKSLRHELVAAERSLAIQSGLAMESGESLGHRDTAGDVGTSLSTSGERVRGSLKDLIVANCRRVEESLRSLEEFGKLLSTEFGATMKQLRYRTYTVEKTLVHCHSLVFGSGGRGWTERSEGSPRISGWCPPTPATPPSSGDNALVAGLTVSSADGKGGGSESLRTVTPSQDTARLRRLRSATVYVLITESACRLPWQKTVEQALDGGADVLQLREKSLNDRELLRRSEWIRDACRTAEALFIVNDRPDIAMASKSDGVHIGQEEFPAKELRGILRPELLVGVSTHDLNQAQRAIDDEADYLGVGPAFPSPTKSFDSFPGLDFVRSAAQSILKPWFAIGGVSLETIDLLISVGVSRIAVASAVTSATNPSEVVREFRQRLSNSNVTAHLH